MHVVDCRALVIKKAIQVVSGDGDIFKLKMAGNDDVSPCLSDSEVLNPLRWQLQLVPDLVPR